VSRHIDFTHRAACNTHHAILLGSSTLTKSSRSTKSSRPTKRSEPKRRQLRFAFGARQRELLGLMLITLSVLSVLALLGVTGSGNLSNPNLSDWWSRALRSIFGWGAYVVAIVIGVLGLGIFRIALGARLQIMWRTTIGLEIAFVLILGAVHAFSLDVDLWKLFQDGAGGGVIGWALSSVVAGLIGRIAAGIVFALLALFAASVALKIPWSMWLSKLSMRLQSAASSPDQAADIPPVVAAPIKPAVAEDVVPAKAVTIKPTRIDQAPITATQLPLRVMKPVGGPAKTIEPKIEPAKPKIVRERIMPSLDLLEQHTSATIAEQEIERKKSIIVKTLQQFGLEAKIVNTAQGPAVTQFGVEPGYIDRAGPDGETRKQKVRVGQISSLANDLALALAATSLRIEAPVPGKSYVGIEVPNDQIEMVGLRGVLASEDFKKIGEPLAFALGRDVSGGAIAADLASMPHVLIAGTTGSGKSVCINAIIMSLIMNNTPEELKLVMIDPKMVELIRFNGLPHLYGKVETDMDRIVNVLRWIAREMDSRYKKFADVSARHVNDYNATMTDAKRGGERLPYIAVLIDELSDLMMSAPVEIEKTISRIAQMARATGIHLVIATQRPSTDVVTGLIKANFPARISFAVASNVDSRVILDSVGAETLLGKGDMLFLSPTANAPLRVQGCYVGEREVDGVVKFWRDRYADEKPEPAPWEMSNVSRLEEIASASPSAAKMEDGDEVLLAKAIELVKRQRSASASLLQRKLRLGYPKAAYLIDRMEEMGIIGPAVEAGRTRDVLVNPIEDGEDWG
jgi:DNA segregation ATPase FtsK/SpoIIIE, S-DNA-T family